MKFTRLSRFLRAILKNWEEPGDEATYVLTVPYPCVTHVCMCLTQTWCFCNVFVSTLLLSTMYVCVLYDRVNLW